MKKAAAWVLLLLLLAGMGHSTYSMFMGRLVEATLILPLLMVVYVWLAASKGPGPPPEQEEDETDKRNNGP